MQNNPEFIASKKPPLASRLEYPASIINKDGSVTVLIPPSSSRNLRDLILACDLDDVPPSYSVMISALIQTGHSMVIPCKGDVDNA